MYVHRVYMCMCVQHAMFLDHLQRVIHHRGMCIYMYVWAGDGREGGVKQIPSIYKSEQQRTDMWHDREVHIYTCIHAYIHTYTHIHTYIHTYTHTSITGDPLIRLATLLENIVEVMTRHVNAPVFLVPVNLKQFKVYS